MSAEDYKKLLDSHDWYFFMSDDQSAIDKWSANQTYLEKLAEGNKELQDLYEDRLDLIKL